MNKVYRLNGVTIAACVLGVLLALLPAWLFIKACFDPAKADNGYVGVIVMGIIMLFFLALSLFGIIQRICLRASLTKTTPPPLVK